MSTRRHPSRIGPGQDEATPAPSSSHGEDDVSEVEDALTPRTTTRTTRAQARTPATATRQRITPAVASSSRRIQTTRDLGRSAGASSKGKGRADAVRADGAEGGAARRSTATPRPARTRTTQPPASISRNTRSHSAQSNEPLEPPSSEPDSQAGADEDESASSSPAPPPVEVAPSPAPHPSERSFNEAADALLDFYFDSRRGRVNRVREQGLWRVLISHKELLLPPIPPATSAPLYINTAELPSTTSAYLKSAITLANMAVFLHAALQDATSAPTEQTIAPYEEAWTEFLTVLAAKDQGMAVHDGVLTLLLDMGTQLYIQKVSSGVVRATRKESLLGEIFSSTLLSRRGYLPADGRDGLKTRMQVRWKALIQERVRELKDTPTLDLPATFPSSDFELELINFVQARRPKRRLEDQVAADEPRYVEMLQPVQFEPPRKRARKSEPGPRDRPRTSLYPAPGSARQATAADAAVLSRRSLPANPADASVPRRRPRPSELPPLSPPPPPPARISAQQQYAIPPPPRPRLSLGGPRYSVAPSRAEDMSESSADEADADDRVAVNGAGDREESAEVESSEAEEEASVEDEVSADEEEEDEEEEEAAAAMADSGPVEEAVEMSASEEDEESAESDDGEATPTRRVAIAEQEEMEVEPDEDEESSSEEEDEAVEVGMEDLQPKLEEVELRDEESLGPAGNDRQPSAGPSSRINENELEEEAELLAVDDVEEDFWASIASQATSEDAARGSVVPPERDALVAPLDKGKGRADPLPSFPPRAPTEEAVYYPDLDDVQPPDEPEPVGQISPPRPIRPIPSQPRPSAPRPARSLLRPAQTFNSDPSSDEEEDEAVEAARRDPSRRPTSTVHIPPSLVNDRHRRERSELRVKDVPDILLDREEPWRKEHRKRRSQSHRNPSVASQRWRATPSQATPRASRAPASSVVPEEDDEGSGSALPEVSADDKPDGGPFSYEETYFFIRAASKLKPTELHPWVELLRLYGRDGTINQKLAGRSNVNLKDKMRGYLLTAYPLHGEINVPEKLMRYLPRTDPRYVEWQRTRPPIDPRYVPKKSGGQTKARQRDVNKRVSLSSSEADEEEREDEEDDDEEAEAEVPESEGGMEEDGEEVAVGQVGSDSEEEEEGSEVAP